MADDQSTEDPEEQLESLVNNAFVPDGKDDVPDNIEWPLCVELLDTVYQIHRPPPAEAFQIANKNKSPQTGLDMEGLYCDFWSKYFAPLDEPTGNKPDLMEIKGTPEKDRTFIWITNFLEKHFLERASV